MTRQTNQNSYSEEKLRKAFSILEGMEDVDADRLRARIYATVGRKQRRKRMASLLWKTAAVAVPVMLAGFAWLYYASNGLTQQESAVVSGNVESSTLPGGFGVMLYGLPDEAALPGFDDPGALADATDGEQYDHGNTVAELYQAYTTLSVPKGNMSEVELDDGTRVWLNSSSRLRFPLAFIGRERRVYLEGEAYFDVAHDSEKPFVVETFRQELTVLGTEFNISAYMEDPNIYTTLKEGSVALKSLMNGSELVLRPGQQASLDSETSGFSTRDVDADELLLWKAGVFVFEGGTLAEAMRKLARWYDIEFIFEDDRAEKMVLRGSMPVQTGIETVLGLLESSGNVTFTTTDNVIKIRSRK